MATELLPKIELPGAYRVINPYSTYTVIPEVAERDVNEKINIRDEVPFRDTSLLLAYLQRKVVFDEHEVYKRWSGFCDYVPDRIVQGRNLIVTGNEHAQIYHHVKNSSLLRKSTVVINDFSYYEENNSKLHLTRVPGDRNGVLKLQIYECRPLAWGSRILYFGDNPGKMIQTGLAGINAMMGNFNLMFEPLD